jgi:hypothetical protein
VAIRVSLALVQSSAAAARYDFVLFQKKNYVCKPSKCMSPQFEKDYSPNKLHNLQKNKMMPTYIAHLSHTNLQEIVLPPQVNINNGSNNSSNITSTSTTTKGSLQVPSH